MPKDRPAGIVGGAILPHALQLTKPDARRYWYRILNAYAEVDELLQVSEAQLVVLATGLWETPGQWSADAAEKHTGVFSSHDWPDMPYELTGHPDFADILTHEALGHKLTSNMLVRSDPLDYGTVVTSRLLPKIANLPIVTVSYSLTSTYVGRASSIENMPRPQARLFGRAVAQAAREAGLKVFVIASCGLSQVRDEKRPYSVSPDGMAFDRLFLDDVKKGSLGDSLAWPAEVFKTSRCQADFLPAEVLLGAVGEKAYPQLLAYEGIQGTGNAAVRFTI